MKQRPKFRTSDYRGEIDKENIEMTTNRSGNDISTVETSVQEGDTLQALSIRFHCPVAELKRLNNIHRDNEIFARRSIKIPFRAFSVAAVHKSGDSSPDTALAKKTVDANALTQKLASVSTTTNGLTVGDLVDLDLETSDRNEANFNQIIFNTRIAHKEEAEEEAEEAEALSDEEVQLLPKVQIAEPVSADFNCSGADWGLSWPLLLGIILVVAFVGPLIYIFYIAEHPEKYHHSR